jgi:hypothetical protein
MDNIETNDTHHEESQSSQMSSSSSNTQKQNENPLMRSFDYYTSMASYMIPDVLQSNNVTQSDSVMRKSSKMFDNNVVNDDQQQFKHLSYIDVQVNLRLIADLKQGEKVMIINKSRMEVDRRYFQQLRRFMSNDSRNTTLEFIDHLINETKKYCDEAVNNIKQNINTKINMEKLINLQSLLKSSITGLGRILLTYDDDKYNKATIETYSSKIQTICDQDLKEAIDYANNK